MSRAVGVYNVYGIKDKNQIVIEQKEVVYPKDGEQINDIHISDYKIIDNVMGKIYACNLTDSFLLSTKKLPLFYINIIYEIPLKTVLLYKIYFCFTIEDDIKSSEQLIGSPINGKFYVEIFINNTKKIIDDKIEQYMGNDEAYSKLQNFTTADEMKQLTKIMLEEVIKQLEAEHGAKMEDFNIPKNIISLKNYDLGE